MNSSALRKLVKQVQVEFDRLDTLMQRHPHLLDMGPKDSPNLVEVDALAVLLHSFCAGVENLFKRIVIAVDEGPPQDATIHPAAVSGGT